VRAAVRRPAGTVRIGTAAGLTDRLERGVDALREHDPDLDVVLVDLPVCERLDALRRGELDLALVRGRVAGPGLRVRPAWSEPLRAVVSHRHRLADRPDAHLADLALDVLRLPADPILQDAVTAALDAAGADPRLGRVGGSVQDTVVEVGADPLSWALLPAEQVAGAASARVRAIPVRPALAVTGHVVTADDGTAEACVENAVAAFRD
jgi:DNA-binding transcriptional LysR family regulator